MLYRDSVPSKINRGYFIHVATVYTLTSAGFSSLQLHCSSILYFISLSTVALLQITLCFCCINDLSRWQPRFCMEVDMCHRRHARDLQYSVKQKHAEQCKTASCVLCVMQLSTDNREWNRLWSTIWMSWQAQCKNLWVLCRHLHDLCSELFL